MKWWEVASEGISEVTSTSGGFTASVSIPVGEDGFFGRTCPACERFFKMRADEWESLPDEVDLWCPYCGESRADAHDFITADQEKRVLEAAEALALGYAMDQFQQTFSKLQRSSRNSAVKITVNRARPHTKTLHTYIEELVRRTIECETCGIHYGVYGAAAFCPICGPRSGIPFVLEQIEGGRRALALEDVLPDEDREDARAQGIFDSWAVDAVENVVTLFETFARAQFVTRVAGHEPILKKESRNVFQRLADADRLFSAHAGLSPRALLPADAWSRLEVVFQQRHVFTHQNGLIDAQYVARVPSATQAVGQRLVVSRAEAEQALADLESLVRALPA